VRKRNTPKMPILANNMASTEPPRVRLNTTRGGSSGKRVRVSRMAKVASNTAPRTKNPMVNGLDQAVVSAWESPKTRLNRPPVTSTTPPISTGSRSAALSFFSHSRAPVEATAANARLTKRVHRHEA
jgi:hypothetical protein